MKKQGDFQRAFGQADAEFEKNIHNTLDALMAREEEKYMKRKMRFTVAIALAAMLILTTVGLAAANPNNLLEMLSGSHWNHPQVLPKATAIVQSNLEQVGGNTGDAQFTVREAVYDGDHFYMTIAVQPLDEKTLLIGAGSEPSDPVSDYRADWIGNGSQKIRDWAAEQGYEQLLVTNVNSQEAYRDEYFIDTIDYRLEPDSTLVILAIGSVTDGPQTLAMHLNCRTAPYVETEHQSYELDIDALKEAELSFTLESSGHFAGAESYDPIDIPEAGVRVESVKLTATALTVYTEIVWEITDVEKYLDSEGYSGLCFRFVDESGEEIPGGVLGGGEISPMDYEAMKAKDFKEENGDRIVQKGDLEAMEVLPDRIWIQAYDCWEKDVYNTYEVNFN